MADVEVKKFADMVNAIGPKTLAAIATAGPDMQVRSLNCEFTCCIMKHIWHEGHKFLLNTLPHNPNI